MSGDPIDVRVGDVWADNDPRGGPTVVVQSICLDGEHEPGCNVRHYNAHAHVTARDGKRRRSILLRRFNGTKSGYLLLERAD